MMSRKQLEANRANAKRSTGPKSDAGKTRSRMNALKHGFSSQEIVLEGEDADQFDALRAQLEVEFAPDSVIERELVDRLAGLLCTGLGSSPDPRTSGGNNRSSRVSNLLHQRRREKGCSGLSQALGG